MPLLHLCNTNFENELTKETSASFAESILSHPIFAQLQYLPLLYAEQNDHIALTHPPSEKSPNPIHLLNDSSALNEMELSYWGMTPKLSSWAKEHQISEIQPLSSLVKVLHSKIYSFRIGKKIAGARLFFDEKEILHFAKTASFPLVLKAAFGLAGQKMFVCNTKNELTKERLHKFCAEEFQQNQPIILEPWVKRLFDFSTQWNIHSNGEIEYLGACRIENSERGIYRATHVGKDSFTNELDSLENHREFVQKPLESLSKLGFVGNLGIDAMCYLQNGKKRLQPIVEMNLRKTMSYVALQIQKKFGATRLTLSYKPVKKGTKGLLPHTLLVDNQKSVEFSRQLFITSDALLNF